MSDPILLTPEINRDDFGTQMVCRDGTLVAIIADASGLAFCGDDFIWRDPNGLTDPNRGENPKDIVSRISEQVA